MLFRSVKKYKIGWIIEKNPDFNYQDVLEKYKYILKKEEYEKVLKQYENYQVDLLSDMVLKTNDIYKKIIPNSKFKNYYEIKKYLKNFYKKYTL